MEQLQLTKKQLKEIGFKKHGLMFKIETINGWFSYGIDTKYRWYHTTKIGDNSFNHVHLDIRTPKDLFTILHCFGARHNIISVNKNREKLLTLAKPLIKFLNEHHNPHALIQITANSVELLNGFMKTPCNDYIKSIKNKETKI